MKSNLSRETAVVDPRFPIDRGKRGIAVPPHCTDLSENNNEMEELLRPEICCEILGTFGISISVLQIINAFVRCHIMYFF